MSKSVNGREPSVDTRDTSSFAVAVRALDPRVLPALGVMDAALVLIEIAVVVSKAACAADDGRPGWERVGAVLEERFSGFNPQELTSYLERLQKQESAMKDLVDRVANGGFRRFALRLLGEAEYVGSN